WAHLVILFAACFAVPAADPQSIARIWDERALAAIRADTPHPPGQARNLFSFSVCMYDAWSGYDTNSSVGYIYHTKHTASDVEAARREAISYAVFRMMKERHAFSRTAANTLAADDALMTSLGYDINNNTRDTSTPAGVGNTIYDVVSQWFSNDGSRGANGTPYPIKDPPIAYPDYPVSEGGYVFLNPPLAVTLPGINDGNGNTVVDINRWQRLQIVNAVDQNGFPQGPIQPYLGAQWLRVRPYELARIDPTLPWIDPGPPPFYGGATHDQFVREVVAVITASSQLTSDDGVTIDISPAVYGNNDLEFGGHYGDGSLDIYNGTGHSVNPVTGLPYAPNVVKRGDYARALSEFWADGPNSETPPGHWNVVANDVSDRLTEKRIGGTGPVVDDLEWDVKIYFAVNAAVHEAGCACWAVKRYYDAWRPLSAVRYLGGLGQSSSPGLQSYNVNGLPLIPNLIELVTASTAAQGGRHAGLTPGKVAVLCWPGETPQRTQANGVRFVHADSWMTYQRTNFVTPAFPGYISGHSTFSRSAAEVLAAITGSKFFPGGLGTYTITNLINEKGPSEPVNLRYATYYDAADGAGLSRIYGGIHPPADNYGGRRVGEMTGKGTWETARKYFDGSIIQSPINLAFEQLGPGRDSLRHNTIRGMYYKMQTAPNLNQPFTDVTGVPVLAVDSSLAVTNTAAGSDTLYRAVRSLTSDFP
ncbi:MAG TPA: hypothetical protein DCE44_12735, partial [Verrucomicrobiales bacterium]|nr:hypothetical protein [Verrucomicrobiales bacterium]